MVANYQKSPTFNQKSCNVQATAQPLQPHIIII